METSFLGYALRLALFTDIHVNPWPHFTTITKKILLLLLLLPTMLVGWYVRMTRI